MAAKKYLKIIDQIAAKVHTSDPALSTWASEYAINHRHRLADDLNIIQQYVQPDAKIVEFGSIPPILTLALMETGYDVTGLDLAPERFSEVIDENKLNIQKVNFESHPVPFPDETFDVILFNEVFEHLRIDLISTFKEVRRILKPGGIMLLSTPNVRSCRGLWKLLVHHASCHIGSDIYDEYDKLTRFGHMGHVREYTAREVSRFMTKVGWKTRKIIFRHYGPSIRRSFPVVAMSLFERTVYRVTPGLSPMFSLVCEKI